MRYLLVLLGLMFAGAAEAIDCETPPSCESLGYSTADDSNCVSNGYVYCPFDNKYKKCVERDCAKMGFTQTDKSSWCADLTKCKTDETFTLCQMPCEAWDYESLNTLAKSGKCKTVTIIRDISYSESQVVNVAANTTVDGGGHTIFLTNTTGSSIQLNNNTVLKNIKIHKTLNVQNTTNNVVKVEKSASVVLENLQIDDLTPTNTGSNWQYALSNNGTVTFRGKNKINVIGVFAMIYGTYNLENSTLDITSTSNDSLYYTTINADNSEININSQKKYSQGSVVMLKNNSKMYINAVGSLAYTQSGSDKITLESGSVLELQKANSNGGITLILNGSAQAPVKLLTHNWGDERTKLDVKNLNATLTYETENYRPKNLAVTPISSVKTSSNWEKVN